ncbi:MAG: amidase [Chromatiales bacterium]|jgi:aspartyl-tRNA(Asn)/glutamyl-tRNA(Gln) amidotransferase subunit A|nr:amidase [Chromatiales bacterium]
MVTELHYRSLTELSDALRKKQVSAVELAEHFIARIEALDGTLNAYLLRTPERALDAARAADALGFQGAHPLRGIPYAVKDLYNVAGLATTGGTRILKDAIADHDCPVVARLNAAGMALLGKTNTVQFAYGGVGINHDHGTPHNPWHTVHHVPGGSSSGSGVAVASGMAPMALGTDTGGSVRIPAALCSVTGLKTTVGRISRDGIYPLSWTLDSVGPLTRNVADSALVYEALAGHDDADPSTHGQRPVRVKHALDGDIRGLRIAFAESVFWEGVDAEVASAVRRSAQAFEARGAKVSSIEFSSAERARTINPRGLIIAAEAYTLNRRWVDERFDELDPIVAHRVIKGRDVIAHEYLANMREFEQLRRDTIEAMRDIDVLLCPATMHASRTVAEVDGDSETYGRYNLGYLRNTAIGNTLNLCGLSVPCGFTSEGLPIGLMLYAKPFDEMSALRAGHAFQCETDWHAAVPALDWI